MTYTVEIGGKQATLRVNNGSLVYTHSDGEVIADYTALPGSVIIPASFFRRSLSR